MQQKLTDDGKTLWEIQNQKNPTVWEVGRKYDPETQTYNEVNGKPRYIKN